MKIKNFKKVHLVTLSGGGDVYHKLVGPETFSWICSDWDGPLGESAYEETISEKVKEEFTAIEKDWEKDFDSYITIGSYDNDRAIKAIGKDFDSASSACKWAIKNNLKLGEEYDGCSY